MNFRSIILAGLIFLVWDNYNAQILITPFGGQVSNSSYSVSYTGGETIISTSENEINIITQGFQQNDLVTIPTGLNEEDLTEDESIPSGYKLLFDSQNVYQVKQMLVYNPVGQIIYQKSNIRLDDFQDWWHTSLNSRYLISGVYFYYIEIDYQGRKIVRQGSLAKM